MMDAITIKNGVLAVLAAAGSYVAHALGGWDSAMKLLVALMAVDYISGVAVAAVWQRSSKSENGALDSRAGFKGLVKKCAVLLLVWIGVLLDGSAPDETVRQLLDISYDMTKGKI